MADPDPDRPGSRGYHASPVPPSPHPSIASRTSRSSLRREQERREAPASHPRPASAAYSSRPHTPHAAATAAAGPVLADHPPSASPPPPPPQPARPPFSPVFALIASTLHSSNRQTIHHPTVHYIFADDDPERLTSALAYYNGAGYDGEDGEGDSDGPSPKDRGILLDMEPTPDGGSGYGYEIALASSLTPDWAVTSARLSLMEEAGNSSGGVAARGGLGNNLVLKIEGVSIDPPSSAAGPGPMGMTPTPEMEMPSSDGSSVRQQQPAPSGGEDYSSLLQEFEKRMSTLRKVVEAGAARQRVLGDIVGPVSEGMAAERGP
ncbi:hypothetical protein N657DRAFT_644454 [Parathielavia appendiculata]|uniref:Uncharacterized protein n=1 Tax=Parathielavia appendiculata TaxID=2587402 RepID=A0AAN6U0S1_9PEZI|nr:hypothetical protein N657DRAFT_644454 [Parathielavia appendiculata]